ncbi:hypothetical protein SFRURICE_012957 [Spodoptera frugiperda]|nr:hypothetical protein SFRURICE_012957 [Spodoptera frugiperda]
MSSITQHTTRRLSHCYWRFELRAHRALCLESRVLSGARDDVGSLDSLAGGCAGVGFDSRVDAKTRLIFMSSITQHTTRRLSHCYWRFELRAHRALCLESRVLSGARDDVGSLDSLAGGCAGVGFDSRVDAKTVSHTALTVSHSRPATL